MWPAVNSQNCVVGIGSKRTMGYVIPLINLLMQGDGDKYPYPNENPLAIILAPTWRSVVKIADQIENIIRSGKVSRLQ